MKKIALYIILFSYSVIMIKPVSPFVADTLAHIFYYAQHMATVHFEDGNFHVHKEIVEEAKETGKQNEVPATKKDNQANDHIGIPQKTGIAYSETKISYLLPSGAALPDKFAQNNYPPPRI